MTDKEAMKLAQDAGWDAHHAEFDTRIEAFAKLVREEQQTEIQRLIALVRAQQITIDKLEAALEQPAPVQEPVAYMSHNKENFVSADDVGNSVPNWTDYYPTPIYATPLPCPTCEALARTVMIDQTGRDA
jgi:hypothetical protein